MTSDQNRDAERKRPSYQRTNFAEVTRQQVKVYRETRFSLQRGGYYVDLKEKILVKQILDVVGPQETILDVPCGAGRYVELLRPHCSRLIELDLSPAMIQENREQWSERSRNEPSHRIEYVMGDAEWLPVRDHSVDVVFCLRLFHHVDVPELRINILREFSRVTNQWVVVSFYHFYCFRHLKKVLRNKPHRGVYLPFGTFRREAERSGLRVVRTYPVSRFYQAQWIVLLRKERVDSTRQKE